jgi:hypothetical protein
LPLAVEVQHCENTTDFALPVAKRLSVSRAETSPMWECSECGQWHEARHGLCDDCGASHTDGLPEDEPQVGDTAQDPAELPGSREMDLLTFGILTETDREKDEPPQWRLRELLLLITVVAILFSAAGIRDWPLAFQPLAALILVVGSTLLIFWLLGYLLAVDWLCKRNPLFRSGYDITLGLFFIAMAVFASGSIMRFLFCAIGLIGIGRGIGRWLLVVMKRPDEPVQTSDAGGGERTE